MFTNSPYFYDILRRRFYRALGYDINNKPDIVYRTASILISILSSALQNETPSSFQILPIDCGLGKTTFFQCFLQLWQEIGCFPDTSILICLSRYSEIRSYLERCKLPADSFAVFSKDDDLNKLGLGKENADDAPILFMTHQMHAHLLRGSDRPKALMYKGKDRTSTFWDESLVPAQPVLIRIDTLAGIPDVLASNNPVFTDALRAINQQLAVLSSDCVYEVPSWLPAIDLKIMRKTDAGFSQVLNDGQQAAIEALRAMVGKPMVIISAGQDGKTLAGIKNRLPTGFGTTIVLDASARHRHHYRTWAEQDDRVVLHTPIVNSYEQVGIRLWKHAVGKKNLKNAAKRGHVVGHLAAVMNMDREEWLVVTYKPTHALDLQKELAHKVVDSDRITFIHWGDHHGTNAHRNIKNVIIVGLWNQPFPYYASLYQAGAGDTVEAVQASAEGWQEVRPGELCHHLIQAVGRSNVRNSKNGIAGDATVYIVAGPNPDPMALAARAFPGAQVNAWSPDPPLMSRSAQGVADVLLDYIKAGWSTVQKAVVREAAGIGYASNLSRVLNELAFANFMKEHTITVDWQRFRLG